VLPYVSIRQQTKPSSPFQQANIPIVAAGFTKQIKFSKASLSTANNKHFAL
jgi:hypothetical protein